MTQYHHECDTELHSPTAELCATVIDDSLSAITVTVECDHCDYSVTLTVSPSPRTRSINCDDCLVYASAMRRAIYAIDTRGHDCMIYAPRCETCGGQAATGTSFCDSCARATRTFVA